MKRTTDTRDESTPSRPAKQIKTNDENSPAFDCFADELEVKASALAAGQLNESGHIVGQVFMLWPMSNKTRKLQLKMVADSLDVVFEGTGSEKLDFLNKDRIKISLKGGKKEAKKAGSPHTLPFKLVFPNGALVKFLASEKRHEAKVVDLFRDMEEESRRTDNDWFCTPLKDSDVPGTVNGEEGLFAEADDFVVLSHESRVVTSPIPNLEPPNELISHSGDHELAINFVHHIGTAHTDTVNSSVKNPPPAFDPMRRSSSHPLGSFPAPQPQATIHGPQKKLKRIKKRDMRHAYAQKLLGSTMLDAASGADLSESKAQKKAKKRARAKAEDARHIPPYHDPALDMVAGFRSAKGGVYTPLMNVNPGASYSLVGVVADVGAIKRTRTGDLSKSYTLVDPSPGGYKSLTVNIFVSHSEEQLLPSAILHQVLLLRGIKCKEFNGKPQGTGYKDSFQWCGYDPTTGKHFYTVSSSESKQSAFFQPSATELEYFVNLADWWRAMREDGEKARSNVDLHGGPTSHIAIPSLKKKKLQIISDLEPGTFVDCVVELLKIWKDERSSDIYVTDYSENKHLQHNVNADTYPLGRRTLKVSVWDGNNDMVDDLELHSHYILKNMRIKKLEGSRTVLEGHLGYEDRSIYKLGVDSTEGNLQDLLSRKQAYERNPQLSKFDPGDDVSNVGEPMQQAHDAPRAIPANAESSNSMMCFHMDQKRTTIEEILRNDQSPNKFRVRARIIEHYPRRIEDFVTVECDDCHKILDDGHWLCPECGDLTGKSMSVRYQFALRIVDDSREELNISVSDGEAAELLFGLDPKDARDDTAVLRNRLKPLIGHLEPWHKEFDEGMRTEGPWFDLCLNSWSRETETGDSIRLYKLFGCRLQP